VLDRPLGKGLRPGFAFALLRFIGWRVVLLQRVPRKCVVVFFPHTSNQGDVASDLAAIRAFYADKHAWNPAQAGPIRFRGRPPG
jgi:hypothetical protein